MGGDRLFLGCLEVKPVPKFSARETVRQHEYQPIDPEIGVRGRLDGLG
jgi:hypothetical protein